MEAQGREWRDAETSEGDQLTPERMENQPVRIVQLAGFDSDLICVKDPLTPGDAPSLMTDDAAPPQCSQVASA
jgi:hypothetical protein